MLVADGGLGDLEGGLPLVALHEVRQRRAVNERRGRQQDENVEATQSLDIIMAPTVVSSTAFIDP